MKATAATVALTYNRPTVEDQAHLYDRLVDSLEAMEEVKALTEDLGQFVLVSRIRAEPHNPSMPMMADAMPTNPSNSPSPQPSSSSSSSSSQSSPVERQHKRKRHEEEGDDDDADHGKAVGQDTDEEVNENDGGVDDNDEEQDLSDEEGLPSPAKMRRTQSSSPSPPRSSLQQQQHQWNNSSAERMMVLYHHLRKTQILFQAEIAKFIQETGTNLPTENDMSPAAAAE